MERNEEWEEEIPAISRELDSGFYSMPYEDTFIRIPAAYSSHRLIMESTVPAPDYINVPIDKVQAPAYTNDSEVKMYFYGPTYRDCNDVKYYLEAERFYLVLDVYNKDRIRAANKFKCCPGVKLQMYILEEWYSQTPQGILERKEIQLVAASQIQQIDRSLDFDKGKRVESKTVSVEEVKPLDEVQQLELILEEERKELARLKRVSIGFMLWRIYHSILRALVKWI